MLLQLGVTGLKLYHFPRHLHVEKNGQLIVDSSSVKAAFERQPFGSDTCAIHSRLAWRQIPIPIQEKSDDISNPSMRDWWLVFHCFFDVFLVVVLVVQVSITCCSQRKAQKKLLLSYKWRWRQLPRSRIRCYINIQTSNKNAWNQHECSQHVHIQIEIS